MGVPPLPRQEPIKDHSVFLLRLISLSHTFFTFFVFTALTFGKGVRALVLCTAPQCGSVLHDEVQAECFEQQHHMGDVCVTFYDLFSPDINGVIRSLG